MMDFTYFQPRADIRQLVSSYYDVKVPDALADKMRAEIANIRIILNGDVIWSPGGNRYSFTPGDVILCGPTFAASDISFSAGTHIFGMAITPLGWAHMFGPGADKMADKAVLLPGMLEDDISGHIKAILEADDDAARVDAVDTLMAALIQPRPGIQTEFLDTVTQWLLDPETTELSDLLDRTELSHRQVDRLCRQYFGSSPKKLHRKFRALHSANRLTWQELTDWRDIATTSYYDQSHFIREFKHFNGRTPSEFIKGAHILVRLTLKERLQITHESPYSLVG